MKRKVILTEPPGDMCAMYVSNHMEGLECVGLVKLPPPHEVYKDDYWVELYKLPGDYNKYGVLYSNGDCQVHMMNWYRDKVIMPPPEYPINQRIRVRDKPSGSLVIRVVSVMPPGWKPPKIKLKRVPKARPKRVSLKKHVRRRSANAK